MAIIHRVRANGKGKTKVVSMTPRRAIRLFCLECMGFNRLEIGNCGDPLYPLFPYRHDGRPEIAKSSGSQVEKGPSDGQQSTVNQKPIAEQGR